MTPERSTRFIQLACLLSLVGLGLIIWSVLDPRPVPVIAAMSVGQGIGTLSFATFLYVVLADLRARLAAGRAARASGPPSSPGAR
ncbi:MAG TPA: hypothetical protein VHB21_08530 [Minicystis sp.]|nr:hypothetical protein [Minicystis sp.]